jgi:hypothetical protein
MESQSELTPQEQERDFELNLSIAPRDAQNRYYKLLLEEQLGKAKKHKGKPPEIAPLELRETILRIAKNTQDIETARKAFKMDRDWENASRGGRAPMGGAVDD